MAHVVRDFNEESVDYVEEFEDEEEDEEILGDPEEHEYGEADDSGLHNQYYDALDQEIDSSPAE